MGIEHLRPYLELEGICREPVFIIGSPRSGTTALGHALNRHPELWASKESYVLRQLFGGERATDAWEQHWKRVNPSWLRAEGVERAEFLGFLGLGVNAMYSSRSEGRRWVDPTPLNTLMVEVVAELFPTASFVHIVRDGRSVVRSMGGFRDNLEQTKGPMPDREMPAWTADFRAACQTWADYVQVASGFAESNPDRCLQVRNEDLTDDPAAGFARVHEFLGVGPSDGPAAFFSGKRINSSFQGDAPAEGAAAPSEWPADRRRTFAEVAGPALIGAGYATASELEAWAALSKA